LQPQHLITVNVIGAGGNGSQVLISLARINEALQALGQPGLHVKVYDPDYVSEHNLGRQHFSSQDLHLNKAEVLISRINRFYGLDWEAVPDYCDNDGLQCNIIISCVDNVEERKRIHEYKQLEFYDWTKQFYWLDFGNGNTYGQVILGTKRPIEQPSSEHTTLAELKTVIDLYPDMKDKETEPSCSMREALQNQDLFINSYVVSAGMNMLWQLLYGMRISYNQIYINGSDSRVNSCIN
jgi:PRTRC genetic system ThiF family protein